MTALQYVVYAERFGWPPSVVDELPMDVEPWLIPIHDLMQEVRADAQKRAGG
ncbi:hypothetical protein [Actinomadura harenae]|uniref:hypothetical protein n=1 Tax=Actinomadura harenae TaxID=2483351 RepID=UPI0013158258|nr:hypothetical protein [Actinomadura harenae]